MRIIERLKGLAIVPPGPWIVKITRVLLLLDQHIRALVILLAHGGLGLARQSGTHAGSQHPSHDGAQYKVFAQGLPEVAMRYGRRHQRVGYEQHKAAYAE